MWLVSIENSFQGLSIAIETVRINEELMEIWPNEVCDKKRILYINLEEEVLRRNQVKERKAENEKKSFEKTVLKEY